MTSAAATAESASPKLGAAVHDACRVHQPLRALDLDAGPPLSQVRQAVAQVAAVPVTVELVEAIDECATGVVVEWRMLGARTIVHAVGGVRCRFHRVVATDPAERDESEPAPAGNESAGV